MTMQQLHPGARWLFRLRAYGTMIFVGAFLTFWTVGFIGSLFNLSSVLIIVLLGLVFYIAFVLIIGEIYSRMSYNRWFFEFTSTNLKMERGIIWKRYSNVPYERIQNVDIHRGIIARMLGFSSVMIHTAGYSAPVRGSGYNVEGYIPSVSIDQAERIRDFVMHKITKKSNSGL